MFHQFSVAQMTSSSSTVTLAHTSNFIVCITSIAPCA